MSTPPIVAGMATLLSRFGTTFRDSFKSILPQVDRLYLYLDGHEVIDSSIIGDERVIPVFSSDVPNMHCAGKFVGLLREREPCFYLGVDDDIEYPKSYVAALRAGLHAQATPAIVGFHGSVFKHPVKSYVRDRTVIHFADGLDQPCRVDVLGAGTVMFHSLDVTFDLRSWPHTNMSDLQLALEAARKGVPEVCIPRPGGFSARSPSVNPTRSSRLRRKTTRANRSSRATFTVCFTPRPTHDLRNPWGHRARGLQEVCSP